MHENTNKRTYISALTRCTRAHTHARAFANARTQTRARTRAHAHARTRARAHAHANSTSLYGKYMENYEDSGRIRPQRMGECFNKLVSHTRIVQ